ncbi:zinc dependent phospholipase C family protein [Ferruginibacter albus]|uniref:zinc dependent phospholipase C family protein n=1 Tax=Ferruginibacter albus TaxID=2875540 RepID=UPI001CC5F330|nr:zinc dependent phospholipase C family protein [Ferruginibacter albus]UAY52189.1 S1/P1 Nuclease [Ferruginibacter albus]
MRKYLQRLAIIVLLLSFSLQSYCWGFFGHQKINYYAVFLLPPEMLVLYKPNINFITEHAVDPDKRRYAVKNEAPRHYIDIDHYGKYPWTEVPRKWKDAVAKFGEDTLQAYGIVPWYVPQMLGKLTKAFKDKDFSKIMKYSAEIGHYIADAHVPLHASENHDGQLTNQKGIHAFWESRVPELLADKQFDFFIGKAAYIKDPNDFIWARVLESGQEADSVLSIERQLTKEFGPDKKYSFEERNGQVIRQYSTAFTIAFNERLNGMVERRMRQAIFAVASFWYTAWVNAGQPDLKGLVDQKFSAEDAKEFEELNTQWQSGSKMIGREE